MQIFRQTLSVIGLIICLFTFSQEQALAAQSGGGTTCSFEASANWFKGTGLTPSELAKTDPSKTTKETKLSYGENITLHVAYRCPARNDAQEAKVSYTLSIERPDGANDPEGQKAIMAGSGRILPEQLRYWAASHNRVTIRFEREKDPPGIYRFKVRVKDHVGNQEILCTTIVNLK